MTKHQAQVLFLCICTVLCSSRSGYAKEKLTFTPKKAGQYQARPESCEIQVFQDSKPDQAYDDLGIINYHDERHQLNAGSLKLEVVMPKIKASACKAGGRRSKRGSARRPSCCSRCTPAWALRLRAPS